MKERRLRDYVDDLELTVALLLYANTIDVEVDVDVDALPEPTNVIPLRRPSLRRPKQK